LNEYISGAVKAIGEELVLVNTHTVFATQHLDLPQQIVQGNVEKVVIVIKDKENVALERFLFSLQNMIQVEPFNKDDRSRFLGAFPPHSFKNSLSNSVQNSMTIGLLGQYFRSFLVKLTMIESQLRQLHLGGQCSFDLVV